MSRFPTVTYEPPVADETPKEARARRERNRQSRFDAEAWFSAECLCGFSQGNVVHDTEPEDREWAGDSGYYDDITTHRFEAKQP